MLVEPTMEYEGIRGLTGYRRGSRRHPLDEFHPKHHSSDSIGCIILKSVRTHALLIPKYLRILPTELASVATIYKAFLR